MSVRRCRNCGVDPKLEADRGEQETDVWAYASMKCPRCGDTVIEHAAPAWINEDKQRMEKLISFVIQRWNERHKRSSQS